MHDTQLTLVSMPTTLVAADARPHTRRPLVLYGLGLACLASVVLSPAMLPVAAIGVMALCAISSLVLGMTRPRAPAVIAIDPDSIVSHQLRETYRTVLFALAELERAAASAPRLHATTAPVLERCCTAAATCGRMVQLGDPLQRYLDGHDPSHIRWEVDRLRARTVDARDDAAVTALTQAAAARTRQLATYDQIATHRDRILARLELVRATFESFTAIIVKLHGADEEQLMLAGESVAEHLDEVGGELAGLEAALETDLADLAA